MSDQEHSDSEMDRGGYGGKEIFFDRNFSEILSEDW